MNESVPAPLSIYQLLRCDRPTPMMAFPTLEAWAIALIHWSIETSEEVTLWLKGEQLLQWYAQHFPTPPPHLTVYHCAESPPATQDKIGVYVPLQPGQLPRQEAYLVAIAPQGSVVLALNFPTLPASEGAMAYSFEPALIQEAMAIFNRAIAIADNTPNALFNRLLNHLVKPDESALTRLLSHHLNHSNQQIEQMVTIAQTPFPEQQFFEQGLQELSTTLTRMKTALSLLHSPNLKTAQRQRYLSLLQQECDRQNSLIHGMNLLTHTETPSPPIPRYTRLGEALPTIVSIYQPLALEKGIQLGYTVDLGLPPVACPPPWLRQIMIHLLNNSLQFTPPQGRVSVTAQVQGEQIQLVIKDTGVGIAKSELHRIFDSFYQGRSTSTESTSGAGLGLTLVRQLLNRCGGSISASSKVNVGSIFRVLLPIDRDRNEQLTMTND
jgi:two-component system phosphate regulon sensor histidine kinase PhoR